MSDFLLAEIEFEDAADFCDAFRIVVDAVAGWHDFLRCGTVEVGTPEGHHSVAGVGGVALAPVSHDRVIGDAGGDGQLVHFADESVPGRKRVDAVRRTVELEEIEADRR